jgi:glycosyltransferase involved in cell wall biosynthesis
MRLLFDCHTFDVGPQGTTTFLAGVLDALPAAAERAGTKVQIIGAAQSREAIDRFVSVPIRHVAMDGGFVRRNALVLPQLARSTGADWVISQYVRPFRSPARTASVIHDVLFLDHPALFGWSYRTIRRAMFGWAARNSDAVITVSDYSRQRIAHHFGISAAAIDIVPNAVDERFVAAGDRGPRPPGPIRLLMVSRLERRKRQDWCIAAAVALRNRGHDVRLDLVGTGHDDYADEVRKLAEGVDAATLHEGIDDEALVALYRTADLFLFPSDCEGFGIPVIEAAALGLPCVVADNSALTELRPFYVGPSFSGTSAEALALTVEDALSELGALRDDAWAQRGRVPAAFNWNVAADRLLAALAPGTAGARP